MIEYETICPKCLIQSRKSDISHVHISRMTGEVTDADFIKATCTDGHSINIFPREGKYPFILAHALRSFQAGQLYEAAASGYAALEDFMKLFIQASTWVSTDQPKDVKPLYDKVASNKLVMGNSTRIIGAYAYLYQLNTGSIIQQRKFEKMSHIRDDIIHAAKIPQASDVNKLLVAIYKHVSIATIRWHHSADNGRHLLPWLPEYKMQLATAALMESDLASNNTQEIINQLTQSTTILLPDMQLFSDVNELNTRIEEISTKEIDAITIAENIPKL
ncbi:hypothetical protein Lpp48_16089 [Lacticaseibacillus paracasei subsp. paracasei Lpp48]|nr:hypothetical protein Lpp48_16089 [Lacticaseibacillus paracasei subsp. paracasei Lpp48]